MRGCRRSRRTGDGGPSKGGQTTKIHAVRDLPGRPVRLVLTPGNTPGIRAAVQIVETATRFSRVAADRGYGARVSAARRSCGTTPINPGSSASPAFIPMSQPARRAQGEKLKVIRECSQEVV